MQQEEQLNQNSNETSRDIETTSDNDGHSPTMSGADGHNKHTLTVREVQKIFEEKNVDISERSVVRYCRKRGDASLLDCLYDENERRYLITPESVENAVDEVRARKIRINQSQNDDGHDARTGKDTKRQSEDMSGQRPPESSDTVKELELKLRDAEITNRVKDNELQRLITERNNLIDRIQNESRIRGQLETEVRLLASPQKVERDTTVVSDDFRTTNSTPDENP